MSALADAIRLRNGVAVAARDKVHFFIAQVCPQSPRFSWPVSLEPVLHRVGQACLPHAVKGFGDVRFGYADGMFHSLLVLMILMTFRKSEMSSGACLPGLANW